MDREQSILKYIDLAELGIEIAPYFNPLVPKRSGNNVLIMDVFDCEKLHQNALIDPNIPEDRIQDIEEVDLVGDASGIEETVKEKGVEGQISYIVSSHNFEHLPNPIVFLQGCYAVLATGGILSMAIPDYRACFDHYRTPTKLSDWIEAYFEDRKKPSAKTIFDHSTMHAPYVADGIASPGAAIGKSDPSKFTPDRFLDKSFSDFEAAWKSPQGYIDAHCSVLFPELFELLILELQRLALVDLELIEVSETAGFEFYAHFRKTDKLDRLPDDEFYQKRHELLVEISKSLGAAPYQKSLFQRLAKKFKRRFS